MTEVDGIKLVNEVWPLDGPYTSESLASAAQAVAELYRYLAHATIGDAGKALPNVPEAYPVFGALMTASHTSDQVLRQLAHWAETLASYDPTLRHDEHSNDATGDSAAGSMFDAAASLQNAARLSAQAGRELDTASGLLSHIYHQE